MSDFKTMEQEIRMTDQERLDSIVRLQSKINHFKNKAELIESKKNMYDNLLRGSIEIYNKKIIDAATLDTILVYISNSLSEEETKW